MEQHYGERKPWKEVLSPSNIYAVTKEEGVSGGIVGGLTGGAFAGFSGNANPSIQQTENVINDREVLTDFILCVALFYVGERNEFILAKLWYLLFYP